LLAEVARDRRPVSTAPGSKALHWLIGQPGARPAFALAATVWIVVLAQLVIFALVQPIYSPIDELHHFFYIDYLYYEHKPPLAGAHPTTFDTTADPTAPPGRSVYPGVFGEAHHEATEGIQPWGYYALMLPVFATGEHGTADQILRIRLVTAVLASLIVPFTFLLARLAVPQVPWVWGAASVLPGLSRGYTFNMSQVTNDVFAILVGSIAVLVLLWLARARLSGRWGVVAGTTAGLALIAKSTVSFIPLIYGITFLVRAFRQRWTAGWRMAAVAAITAGSVFAVPWIAWNLVQYRWIAPRNDFEHLDVVFLQFYNLPLWRTVELWIVRGSLTWWVGEVLAPPPPKWMIAIGQLGLVICLFGLARSRFWKDPAASRLKLVLGFTAAGFLWLMAVALSVGIPVIVGRYAYPLFPGLAVCMAAGAFFLGRFGRQVFFASAVVLAVTTVFAVCNTVDWLRPFYHFKYGCV